MNRRLISSLLYMALSIGAASSAFANGTAGTAVMGRTMHLASLEWLPYVGPALEQQGWSAYVVQMAAVRAGLQLRIDYFPWRRAMQLGMKDAQYAGYFPAYYTEERVSQCHFSAPIGNSTIGLAYLKKAPLAWNSLQDLSSLTIGVVAGYSNGTPFDTMVRDGKLHVDASPSDVLNLRKLLAGRVETIVIDKLALRYLLLTDARLAKDRAQIVFHEKPLAELSMRICFQRSPEGEEMRRVFDASLQSLQVRKLESEYFRHLEHKTAVP